MRRATVFMIALATACRPAVRPTPTEPKQASEAPSAAMSTGDLRAAIEVARAEKRFSELAALISALEARAEIAPTETSAIIDSLNAEALESFAAGAAEGSQTRAMIEKRLAALAAHRRTATRPGDGLVVLLPLSGPHAALGVEVRAAIMLASVETGVTVTVLDSLGTVEGAEAAVDKAASEHRAGAILGPIGERESRAAAARALARGIAIGLLSPDELGAAPSGGVFRLWPSRDAEAAEAAAIALELGYDAPAILAPRDDLGAAAAEAFIRAAKQAGATSVRAGFYDPSATELEPDIKAFLGLVPLENERLRRHLRRHGRKKGWKTFSPDVDFDLLYIPDTYDRAALVASYLPFFNVELRAGEIVDTLGLRKKHGGRLPSVVQLLGNDEWHHPSLMTRGGSALDGAIIAETCVGGAGEDYLTDDAAQLAGRLRRAIGKPPSRIASQAYDVAFMIFSRYKQRAVADAGLFAGAKSSTGACGPQAIDSTGQLRRSSTLLRVDGDALVLHEW